MKYIKQYNNFLLTESYNISTNGIKHFEIPKIQKNIHKNLTQLFRLSKDNVVFIGGAGKGLLEDLVFDINICINKQQLIKENNIEEDNIFDFVQTQLKRLGHKCEIKKSEDRIVVQWPTQSSIKQGVVETSIQFTDYINWVSFSRHSPNLNEGKNKYSGKYREALLKAIVESIKQEVSEYYDDKDTVKEYIEYYFDVHKGLYDVTKSFEGKHGLFRKAQIIESKKKLVTNDPNEFIKVIFGEKAIPENYMTFEQCWEAFNKDKSYNKKRNKIIEKFKKTAISMKLSLEHINLK